MSFETVSESPSTSVAIASENAPNILILFDDCLQHVFKFLDLDELCNVADVCSRFRSNAQTYFEHSKLKDSYTISCADIDKECTFDFIALNTVRVLRNFGAFIKVIKLFPQYCAEVPSKYHVRFTRMLNRYCRGTLDELHIYQIVINDEIALLLQPVLWNLRKFSINDSWLAKSFTKMLPKCAPKCQELKFSLVQEFKGFTAPKLLPFDTLPKLMELEKLCLDQVNEKVYVNLIEDIVKLSPQLKSIELKDCRSADNNTSYFAAVFRDISTAQIPLEYLGLVEVDLYGEDNRIADEISRIKTLKTLRLTDVINLTPAQFLVICKNLAELTEIRIFKPMNKGKSIDVD